MMDPSVVPLDRSEATTPVPSTPLAVEEKRIDDDTDAETDTETNQWRLTDKLREFDERNTAAGFKRRELGVTWSDLTVRAPVSQAAVNENVLSQFNLAEQWRRLRHKPALKPILSKSHGCVKPGEMLLVLGRPGSGCTTLLKMLANKRAGYAEVDGSVWFGSMPHDEAVKYRGQIIMNSEEEIFFPTLTVGQTMEFATSAKVPSRLPSGVSSQKDYASEQIEFLLSSLGISHTRDTKIGNEYIRGVSGGERKRVSLLECLASRASVFCWDNSTRGLDASNALEWARSIRAMTDVQGLSTIVTLYQASNDIYSLFDKVLVLDQGNQIYYGPREEARPFMESMGFVCEPGANVADFLTGVTVPTERQVRSGYQDTFPRTAGEILDIYRQSQTVSKMTSEYAYPNSDVAQSRTQDFQSSILSEKSSSDSLYTVNFTSQIRSCAVRQYQIIGGDLPTFAMKQAATLIQALIAGSLWYHAPGDSTGLFLKGGAMFWSLLYFSLAAMSEVVDCFTGRPVITKHKSFAYIHPAATCIAQIAVDIPSIFVQVTLWSVIVYFMVGLSSSASAFFTYWVVLFVTNLCSCALFRAIGSVYKTFDGASKISGYVICAIAMYIGYQIPITQMHPWFRWLVWINPLAYGFEALMGNELHLTTIDCAGTNIIPHGKGYTDSQHQSCAGVPGAKTGAAYVAGDDYLDAMSYSHSRIWRNFGIVWALWVFFTAVTVVAVSRWLDASSSSAAVRIPREKMKRYYTTRTVQDEETQPTENTAHVSNTSPQQLKEESGNTFDSQLLQNSDLFTWRDLNYTVETPSGPRVLLHNVQGWVKPGTLTALMGSSGAGKTTLLDVLAQRKTEGKIQGSILVNGRPLPISFQRSTGYCEQLDVHEPYSTVREALEFSALLRQSRDTPRAEKLRYVDVVLDLLELHDLADSLIGKPGAQNSLGVEQRKRVTIAVELVAKPKVLIFLDEPTSGLDGQSAYNTVRFLRKLADAGQAVLVTIHQPSALLFTQFDKLLLLAKGGKTVYFGDIGRQGDAVRTYFAQHGAPCPSGANPAEHVIDVVSGIKSDKDWNQIWLGSPEYRQTVVELNEMIESATVKDATFDEEHEYATPLREQLSVVLNRMNITLYRNTGYINNKILLHIGLALFNGFTYWKIGNAVGDIQLRLFTIWVWMFIASGVVNQLQPLFIEKRDIYDAREKKARIYSWKALVVALIVSELPYLIVCGVIYFVCWYYTVGFSSDASKAGSTFFIVLIYEMLYTGIGQFTAAFCPNAVFAALVNPLIVGVMVSFCGVLVPYDQLVVFWKYTTYYINPVTYLMGSMLTFAIHDVEVKCTEGELAVIDPPSNATCGDYLKNYLGESGANLVNPDATSQCRVCQYTKGSDYLRTINLNGYSYGWGYTGLVALFICSSFGLVFLFMKLKTKASKKVEK